METGNEGKEDPWISHTLAHTALIHKSNTSLHKIDYSQDLPPRHYPNKENYSSRSLT